MYSRIRRSNRGRHNQFGRSRGYNNRQSTYTPAMYSDNDIKSLILSIIYKIMQLIEWILHYPKQILLKLMKFLFNIQSSEKSKPSDFSYDSSKKIKQQENTKRQISDETRINEFEQVNIVIYKLMAQMKKKRTFTMNDTITKIILDKQIYTDAKSGAITYNIEDVRLTIKRRLLKTIYSENSLEIKIKSTEDKEQSVTKISDNQQIEQIDELQEYLTSDNDQMIKKLLGLKDKSQQELNLIFSSKVRKMEIKGIFTEYDIEKTKMYVAHQNALMISSPKKLDITSEIQLIIMTESKDAKMSLENPTLYITSEGIVHRKVTFVTHFGSIYIYCNNNVESEELDVIILAFLINLLKEQLERQEKEFRSLIMIREYYQIEQHITETTLKDKKDDDIIEVLEDNDNLEIEQ